MKQNYNLFEDRLRTINVLKKKSENFEYEITNEDLIFVENCIICESKIFDVLVDVYYQKKLNFNRLVRCKNCSFIYRKISPSLNWFEKCWKKIASDDVIVFNEDIEKIRIQRYENYCSLIKKYISGNKILDIGSAYGSGANVFKNAGFDIDCIEAEDNKANYISKFYNLPVVSRTIENYEQNIQYDGILFSHCLEHVDKPKNILCKIFNIMKDDGVLYLEVPLLSNSMYWFEALYITHKNYFTEYNLTELLNTHNFEIIEYQYTKESENGPEHFGLLLKKNKNNHNIIFEKQTHTKNEILDLVFKNFPISPSPFVNNTFSYNVDKIDHFYQTIRLDKNILTYNSLDNMYDFKDKN